MDARVAWRDVNLSLLRGFPHASLTATDLSVSGVHAFGRDTLFSTRHLRFVLDVRSVIGYLRNGRPMVIRELSFDQPVVRLRRLADGTANWNITKPGPPPTASMTEATHAVAKQVAATATAAAKQKVDSAADAASAKARRLRTQSRNSRHRKPPTGRAIRRSSKPTGVVGEADARADSIVSRARQMTVPPTKPTP